jgi:phytoene dehydrogenase-like protein
MSAMTRRGFIKEAALAPLALKSLSVGHLTAGPAVSGNHFDIVIAGAGHNSLVTAAYLAKAGYRCVVLEEQPAIGGGVRTAEPTLPDFKMDLFSTNHSAIQFNPLLHNNELDLYDYGLEYIVPDPIMHMQFSDGSSITQWRDLDRTCAEIAKFSKKDAVAYRRMLAEYESIAPTLGSRKFLPIGFAEPLDKLLSHYAQGRVWQRRLAMSAYDLVGEIYEDAHLRSFFLAVGHLVGIRPGDAETGIQAFSLIAQQRGGRPIPKGGSGMLSVALGRFIEAHNGVILTNKRVVRLITDGDICRGVECADGSSYHPEKAVLSTIHIKHLVHMAPRELWGEDFLENVKLFQPEQAMFAAHYATKEPPKYPLAGGGTISACESVLLVNPERILRLTYDNDRGEVNLEDPPLQIVCPSVADSTRAPAGFHMVKILGFQPYNLKEGPERWSNMKDEVAEANLNYLRRFAPNLTEDKILARFIQSPLDIERSDSHMWRGSAHAGANDPAQSGAMRPVPGWAQHRMPITGLYQTGATTYPGGAVTGAPGRNAAMIMLRDFGKSIEQVVGGKKGMSHQ